MNGQAVIVRKPKDTKRRNRQQLRYAVNLCCLYGIAAVSLHLLLSLISSQAAGNYVLFYCLDIFSSIVGSLAPALALAHMGRGIRKYLYTPSRRKTTPFDSFVLVVFGLCGCMVANMLCTILDSYLPDVSNRVYISFAGTFGNFLLMLTASAVVPAICEEIPCRGYLYGMMAPYGHLTSILLSSFIFGMMHSSFNAALFAFICGCIFGCIRKTSNRFWLSVIVHFLNNALSTIGVFIRVNTGSEGYASFLRISSMVALCLFAGSIFLLYRRRVRILHFRKCPFPLRKREKLWVILTTPVFWVFILIAVMVKFL